MIQSIENGRKEDGNRSIADKIIKRLHDLDKTVENNQGRWAWELLQNAKDSIADEDNRSVAIQIELNFEKVEFRHNGTHFTERDIRGLINQISSKEIEQGEETKKTGRFGTGFLTTHLLSKVIEIKGIVKTENSDFYSFEFPLDREGSTTSQLVPKIEGAWSGFHASATKLSSNYNKDTFNTTFGYALKTESQKNIAQIGIEEFTELIPFVLAFIPKIGRVEIINNITSQKTIFENSNTRLDEFVIPISKKINDVSSTIYILYSTNEKVSIACELQKTSNGYLIKSHKEIPKLFCDFPLIGTEKFFFPIIVNSFFFHPQTERDGIWLKGKKDAVDIEVDENQNILISAVELFKELLPKISENNFFELYNISDTRIPQTNEKYFDETWYKEFIQKPIRDLIINVKLVELELEGEEKQSLKDLFFPLKSYTDSIQEKIWQFTFDLFPKAVCKKSHLNQWCALSWESWNKIHYAELVKDLAKQASMKKLSESLGATEIKTFDWLNSLCKFILEDESNLSLFEMNIITPNQNGVFKKKSELYIDKIKDSDLLTILQLLGEDWREILIHDYVGYGKYPIKEKKDIANRITEKLRNPPKDEDAIKAISLLSEWFETTDPELCKTLFSEVYRKRAELFMNTISDKESLYKVMRSNTDLAQLAKVAKALEENPKLALSIEEAQQLTNLFKEFNVNSISELKEIILSGSVGNKANRIEINQDVLISLGVTSMEELEAALKDKNISSLFMHSSTPNASLFLYVQTLITRAKANILNHLQTLPDYDCSEMEELATTVIGGIKKEGLLIHIVIRPSDNGEVIVYYTSEKDTLDYANAELWIDNGKDLPRHLTLGKILKKTGINKIPV